MFEDIERNSHERHRLEENIKDIFIRLLCQSDPVLVHYRKTSDKVMRKTNEISDQDLIVKSLILEPLSSEEIANL